MATLDLPEQIAALEAMCAELEVALDGDENWRALCRAGASDGAADPDRRDRDARLVKALETNPLYVAWAHIADAVDALRDADNAAAAAETGDDLTRTGGTKAGLAALSPLEGGKAGAPWPEVEDEPGAEIELPQDIRERIRADAVGDAGIEQPTEPPDDEAEPVAVESPQATDKGAHKLAAIPSLEPIAAPTRMEFSDRLHKLEVDMDELNEALEAPTTGIAEPLVEDSAGSSQSANKAEELATMIAPDTAASEGGKAADEPDSDVPNVHEPAEAKVTFVRRRSPAAVATAGAAAEAVPAGNGFVPPAAAAAEAEVTIVKPEDPATAPVKRFLKALSGD